MMKPVILFIAVSLDGYIADAEGNIDWLMKAGGEGDNGYDEMYRRVDTVVMGRKTYEHVLVLTDSFPYRDKDCYVFSTSSLDGGGPVTFVQGDVTKWLQNKQQESGTGIWLVGGADIIDPLLNEELIDEYIITFTPDLLGSGIPLFKQRPGQPKRLHLYEVKRWGELAQLHYKRVEDLPDQ
ncbi:dihydrofolate reductase family protein [Marinococcus luteus]|uniref:dihydrofolate reductase family protein n=1 Tax=Marinococcus luteus TaxID=1122204 RepID=UPI002ACD131D|nr:dihydrofolate reductase family protein [Marinococcus luteus]MDZ5783516.1 dihydrofolate reductase family protein [Marinococcus luteus]